MLRSITFFIGIIFCLSSCETVMDDIDLGETPDLISVEALLTDSAMVHTVRLTGTRDYFSKDPFPAITGAEVSITDLTTGEILSKLTEDAEDPGLYTTAPDVKGTAGHAYQLNVTSGTMFFRAIDTLFSVSTLDKVEVDTFDFNPEWNGLFISANEPKDAINYYTWRIYFNDTLYGDYSDVPFSDDKLLGESIEHIMLYFDVVDDGRDHITNVTDTVNIKVQQLGISHEAYLFHQSLNSLLNKGGMFDSPMAGVTTNVWEVGENGEPVEQQSGFFMTAGMSEKSIQFSGY